MKPSRMKKAVTLWYDKKNGKVVKADFGSYFVISTPMERDIVMEECIVELTKVRKYMNDEHCLPDDYDREAWAAFVKELGTVDSK